MIHITCGYSVSRKESIIAVLWPTTVRGYVVEDIRTENQTVYC